MGLLAPCCGQDVSTPAGFVSHLEKQHGTKSTLVPFKCVVEFCSHNPDHLYKTVTAFKSHWYRVHYVKKQKKTVVPQEPPSLPAAAAISVVSSVSVDVIEHDPDLHISEKACSDEPPAVTSACNLDDREGSICSETEGLHPLTVSVQSSCEGISAATDEVTLSRCPGRDEEVPEMGIEEPSEDTSGDNSSASSDNSSGSADSDCVSDSSENFSSDNSDEATPPVKKSKSEIIVQNKSNSEVAVQKFVLNLASDCSLTNTLSTSVIVEVSRLCQSVVQDFTLNLSQTLTAQGVSVAEKVNIQSLIENSLSVFKGMENVKHRGKILDQVFNIVRPKRILVGRRLTRSGYGHRRKTKIIRDNIVYVPITKVLKKLLKHSDYSKITIDMDKAASGNYNSYCDGEAFKNNSVLKNHPDALKLILYYDEVEVCDPLGSKEGFHKLGVFYYTLENIHPKFRSNLDLIHVAAVVKFKFIKDYGIDCVLAPILKDLKKLEKGLYVSKLMPRVYGTVIALTGDNLGVHLAAGFKCGFTAYRICRFCVATPEQLHSLVKEDPQLLRTVESYTQQVLEISEDDSGEKSREYGITRGSTFNELSSFHVIRGLPCDCMHDLLEGILPLTLKKLLYYLIYTKKYFTLRQLYDGLAEFDWGNSETSSKPSRIKTEHLTSPQRKIKQSASQTWQLAMSLPLVIGSFVDFEDPKWENFTCLLELCRIVFSPVITQGMLDYLDYLIPLYLQGFIDEYNCNLTPKQHFLLHYVTLIQRFGQLCNFLAMRMEAKHKLFKKIVRTLCNYKNIPWIVTINIRCCRLRFLMVALSHNQPVDPLKKNLFLVSFFVIYWKELMTVCM